MKARSLVMMLGILFMSFTGFGQTTTDLTDNSTPEIVHMDISENVVSAIDYKEFRESFRKADAVFNEEFKINYLNGLHKEEMNEISPETTNKQSYRINHTTNQISPAPNIRLQHSNKDPSGLNLRI